MEEKELAKFVEWLGQSGEFPKGTSFDETISWINELATSKEGQQILGRLIKTYKNKEMEIFKEGGKLDYLLCLQTGGRIQDCGCDKKIKKNQPGGSIASRLWNKWTGKDKYVDGYGTTRSHAPVRESAHRTILKAADSPLVQAIPVVGDIADGYVAADYAAKGNYKPALAAIGAGLILPNAMEVGARMVPSSTYRNIANKVDDAIEVVGVEDDLGRKYVQKNREWVPENTDEIKVLGVEKPSKWNRTSDTRFNAVEDNSNRWIPETQYDDDLNVVAGSLDDSMSSEPWWGWDPVEYQKGGEISRRDALTMLRTTGSSNSESRKEYRDAKRDARESGLRGREMRQAARNATMERGVNRILPALDDTVEIIDRPIEDRLEALPTISGMAVSNSPRGIITTPRTQERPEILTFQGDFNTAFGNARKMGEDRFYWNDKEYTTELADPNKLAIQTAPSANDSFVEKYVPANHNPGGMPAAAYDVLYTLGANLRNRKRK